MVSNNAQCEATIIVCGEHDRSLLSWETLKKLCLINTVNMVQSAEIKSLKSEYGDILVVLEH